MVRRLSEYIQRREKGKDRETSVDSSFGGRESLYHLLRMQKLAKNKETFVPRLKLVIW